MAYTDIDKSDDYFNTVLYTGNGTTQSITGVGFQPDWTWIKTRSTSRNHQLFDSVRGATKQLFSNLNNAESTGATSLTSFDSDGFSVGSSNGVNGSGETHAAWNWYTGATAVSNTVGDINSTVSANTTSGFSIVSWTGTGTNPSTIGHGLGTAPSCIILKNRDSSGGIGDWYVGHDGIGWTDRLKLNTDVATAASSTLWNNTAPTSSVFTISSALNFSGDATIAYCFAEKKGFSKFGSYTGNGSTDGTFVYTGFKPAWVMVKNTVNNARNWTIIDNKRNSFNPEDEWLYANASDATYDASSFPTDFVSNGFKIRNTGSYFNTSGENYIYMAFAENPFVTSTGIPACAR